MTDPFLTLLRVVVDRLRDADFIKSPPAVLVLPEEDEPDEDRPGQGDNISDMIDVAMNRSGVVIVVYVEGSTLTGQRADLVDFRVQVSEAVIQNRHPRGTQKTSWKLLNAVRLALHNYQSPDHPEWSPIRFVDFQTLEKSTEISREARFTSQTFIN